MKKTEKSQVHNDDYFLFGGEVVKVCQEDEFRYAVYVIEQKNGNIRNASIENLQPITINPYTLESAGITPTDDNVFFYVEGVRVKFNRRMGVVDSISHDESGACLDMIINDFHVLQNALRLFGVEVELRQ